MSNREEREKLRQQRLAQQTSQGSSDRRRLVLGYIVAGILAAAVIAGLVAVIASSGSGGGSDGDNTGQGCDDENAHVSTLGGGTTNGLECDDRGGPAPPAIQFGDLEESAKEAGCELKVDLPDEGSTHVEDTQAVTYKSTPPTSGNHNVEWIADGAYKTPLSIDTATSPNVRNFVHSMEHGRVEIQYSPDLPQEQQLAIKGMFDEDPGGILLFPNPNMPYAVAATAWTQLVGCPTYDELDLDVLRNFRDTYRGNGPENFPF